jgi:flagella basal body P-ring formation protein FlgA
MSFTLALVFAAAAPFADLDSIDRQVAQFTGASIGQPGGAGTQVDRRLRLRPCFSPLALAWHGARRDTVVVQCPDAGSWKLFVPVTGGNQASALAEMPAISRGDAVTVAVRGDGFTVSQPGEALEGGPIGAWIKVRTVGAAAKPGASETMRAQIVRPGLVRMPLD